VDPAFDPAGWAGFATAEVGAAAALAGLLVVAISINVTRLLQLPQVVARLAGTLILFGSVLLVGTLLLVPDQGRVALGIEIAAVGAVAAFGVFRLAASVRLDRRYRRNALLAHGLARLTAVLIVIAGVLCAAGVIGGLYWLVPAVVLAFVVGLANAWVALIEILR
jgi:hypothetical protein